LWQGPSPTALLEIKSIAKEIAEWEGSFFGNHFVKRRKGRNCTKMDLNAWTCFSFHYLHKDGDIVQHSERLSIQKSRIVKTGF
jgi:hypothetical protein